MIRRILVVGGIGLALAGGARFGLDVLAERAWAAREQELLGQALFLPEVRRPWEIKFESLQERALTSPTFDQLEQSSHRPAEAWETDAGRPLDELEKLWVEGMLAELYGIEPVLRELRRLEPEDLEWNGAGVKLAFLRECTSALCGRAWLAVEAGNGAAAGLAFADALRLTRATDDGTTFGTMVRCASERDVLGCVRAALALRPPVAPLRAALVPLLEDLAYDPGRAERCIRRDLSFVDELLERGEPWNDHAWLLDWAEPVEEALARTRAPAADTAWAREAASGADPEARPDTWNAATRHLHALHAQRNVALTALAVAAWRELRGVFPATLAELDDLPREHALDPLTGEPLPYSRDEAGARVGPAAWGVRVDVWEDAEASPYVWTLR